MKGIVLGCLLVGTALALCAVAAAQDAGVTELDAKLCAATDAMLQTLAEKNPEGKEYTIAALPLIDLDDRCEPKRPRGLGMDAAAVITRHLVNKRLDWLRVQSRIDLGSILEERRFWLADFVQGKAKAGDAPEDLLEGAELLVVGSTSVAGPEVVLELKVAVTRTGDLKAAEQVRISLSRALKDRLSYAKRCGKGGPPDGDGVVAVTDIRVAITAQRANPFGQLIWEGEVKPGGELCCGDQFNITFATDADACVYIFCYGSDRKATLLFPTDDWEEVFEQMFGRKARPVDNYCYAEWDYTAPGPDTEGIERFYKLDNKAGRNILYFCAHREKRPNIPDIKGRLQAARTDKDRLDVLRKVGFDYVEPFEFQQKVCPQEVFPGLK